MKKLQFFLLAAVAIVFAACSNDDVVLTDNGGSDSSWNGGDGYIAVSITMPTSSTRATSDSNDSNEQFAYGTESEYDVKNAYLLLFTNDMNSETTPTETDAVFHSAYRLDDATVYGPDGTTVRNITTTNTYVQEIDTDGIQLTTTDAQGNTVKKDEVYALVVLNANDVMTVSGQGVDAIVHFGSVELTHNDNKTFEDLLKATYTSSSADAMTSNGIYMTNAPLANIPGGTSTVNSETTDDIIHTLSPVLVENIRSTETEARNYPAADIYVERGVAKITVSQDDGFHTTLAESNGNVIDVDNVLKKVALNGYVLDRTNTEMYNVRNPYSATTNSSDVTYYWWDYNNSAYSENATANSGYIYSGEYRMIGSDVVGYYVEGNTYYNSTSGTTNETTKYYRTYWAKDPNYDGDNDEASLSSYDDESFEALTNTEWNDFYSNHASSVSYCMENTFDVDHMNKNETTRIIVKTTFYTDDTKTAGEDPGDSFYAIGDVGGDYAENIYPDEIDSSAEEKIEQLVNDLLIGENPAVKAFYDLLADTDVAGNEITTKPHLFSITVVDDASSPTIDVKPTKSTTNAYIRVAVNSSLSAEDFADREVISGVTPDTYSSETYTSFTTNFDTNAVAYLEALANSDIELAYYKDGICYYPVLIKHFGDELTYWDELSLNEAYPNNGTYVEYPTATISTTATSPKENEWLGRYGVLRNNWYDLTISSVKKLGYPTLPPAPTEADDDINAFLGLQIHILAWSKRTQDIDL